MLWYNRTRLHSTLADVSPMRFEENWLANQPRQASARVGYGIRIPGARSDKIISFSIAYAAMHRRGQARQPPRFFSSVVSDRILGCLFVDGTVDRRYRRLLHCDLLLISYLNKTNSYTKIGLLMNRRQ